ncbi:PspC domain-containing protein [Carboxylicivirga sediminis]|uniref:PspC domain-containing protein n=1 Tax=Carboxylicivirga sediminis TaxID=2006564 RepID=A0A941F1M7_9BACT|nr:PspC domain-containing protein [Carboxylicivirga sediminis]MBR8535091.1 PspC domain-containing protein [Carboxylicivirga sediminis]
MNKTININLDGFAFKIEEEAYERLNEYIETIKKRLGNDEEAKEVIADIESRIAELFHFKCQGCTIALSDVEEIIHTIGEPSEIVDEEEAETQENAGKSTSSSSSTYVGKRSLFRDPDDRILGGVCAGLGAYFDVDPLVFRIIAVVTTLMSVGVVPIIYIILWIAMPKAKTLGQRIEMRGGITFKKMGDNIKEEYEAVSSKLKEYKNKPNYKRMQQRANKTGDAMASGLYQLLNIFGIILGIGIVIWSVLSIMGLVGFFAFKDTIMGLAVSDGNHFLASVPDRFLSHMDQTLLSAATFLVIGIPFLVILYLGLKLIFHFKGHGKVIGMTALILWLAGIVLVFFTGVRIAKSFEQTGNVSEQHSLMASSAETIYLKPAATEANGNNRDYLMDMDHLELFSADGELIIEGAPVINITHGDRFQMTIDKKARGLNEEEAEFNAQNTVYNWSQNDSIVYLDKRFIIAEEALVRNQKVFVTIQIPYGKQLEVSPYLDRFINEY